MPYQGIGFLDGISFLCFGVFYVYLVKACLIMK